ncbi:hypothetical protein [Pseudoxanthomonas mexicana]|uniref:hypothetical protein n=1 Tax=Pseudoxanthomonas mexicana TaxID=128785 RepID=UPI00398B0B84
MPDALQALLDFIGRHDGIGDKMQLARLAADEFKLIKDRAVYCCADYAVRFSASETVNFGNTVASLSRLQKYDDRPFIACVVTPQRNHCLLANTTFLKKVSHSSQALRENNIRGSFNGSDIVRELEGIENCAANIQRLFAIHAGVGFEGNLPRLVEATNGISPTGVKFAIDASSWTNILAAPARAIRFAASAHAATLKAELDAQVEKYRAEILVAALIENVNVRGRVIEYLIAGEDEALRQNLVSALRNGRSGPPAFKTGNALGDYSRRFEAFDTETDVKTKVLILNSNPKAYNLDKVLEFLARDRSVFGFYFVGIDPGRIVATTLVSMFQQDLLRATLLLRHWAGRNSRGVAQFEGTAINDLIESDDTRIDEAAAIAFLERVANL